MDTDRIAWDPTFEIGAEEIDRQHRQLVELIGAIPDVPTPRDEVLRAEVLAYAATHLLREQAFMAQIGYPGRHAHANEHKTLARLLLAYQQEYDAGMHDLRAFKQFMYRWVRDHVMDEDHRIGEYLAMTQIGAQADHA